MEETIAPLENMPASDARCSIRARRELLLHGLSVPKSRPAFTDLPIELTPKHSGTRVVADRRFRREPGASAPGRNANLRGLQARAFAPFSATGSRRECRLHRNGLFKDSLAVGSPKLAASSKARQKGPDFMRKTAKNASQSNVLEAISNVLVRPGPDTSQEYLRSNTHFF